MYHGRVIVDAPHDNKIPSIYAIGMYGLFLDNLRANSINCRLEPHGIAPIGQPLQVLYILSLRCYILNLDILVFILGTN